MEKGRTTGSRRPGCLLSSSSLQGRAFTAPNVILSSGTNGFPSPQARAFFFLREQRSLILQNELRLRTEFPRDPRRPLQSSRPGSNPSSTTFKLRGGGTSFWTSASSFGNWKRGWGEWQQRSGSAEARGRLPSWYHRCLICLGLVEVSPPSRPWALPKQPGDDRARQPSEVAPWPRVAGVSSGAPGTPCLWRVGQVIRVS